MPDYDRPRNGALQSLAARIALCDACPRLVTYLSDAKAKWRDHRCRPVPGWGDENARAVIVGLAPGIHGAGKTGRMFTFDASGEWVYGILHEVGLASRPVSVGPGDGLRLRGVYIAASLRCAPPQNRPLPEELARCRPFLAEELSHFAKARVVMALGRIAHEAVLRCTGARGLGFAHGAEHTLPDGRVLIDSYHPSRRNTNTGLLTREMWRRVFVRLSKVME